MNCMYFRNILATVKILPEVTLPDSLHEVRHRSLDRYRSDPVGLWGPVSPVNRRHVRRQQAISQRDAMMTVWPHWVHNQYNATTLMQRVKLQLSYLRLGELSYRRHLWEKKQTLFFNFEHVHPVVFG
jgi:hypothetical protein